MYADRYHRPGLQPGSLTASVAIVGAMIAGLVLSAPNIVPTPKGPPMRIIDVFLPPVPPPDLQPQPDKPQPAQRTILTAPKPQVPVPSDESFTAADPVPTPPDPAGTAIAAPPLPPVAPPAPAPVLPALVGATVDPRFADALQPPYPAAEARAEQEGNATVLVTIGVDGRVKRVERVSADSDGFYRATERQALAHWRFKPATRGGIPVESTKTMTVHF